MTRVVDLDDIAGLERAFHEIQHLMRIRESDPELRIDIERLLDGLCPSLTSQVRAELDEAIPAVVLEARWRDLIPNKFTLGSFPPGEGTAASSGSVRTEDSPHCLSGVVREMARFTDNLRLIAEGALKFADQLGIDEQEADEIVCTTLRAIYGGAPNGCG